MTSRAARNHPLVLAILGAFPGAEVQAVRTSRANEPPPPEPPARVAVAHVAIIPGIRGWQVQAGDIGDDYRHPNLFPSLDRAERFAAKVQAAGSIDPTTWSKLT